MTIAIKSSGTELSLANAVAPSCAPFLETSLEQDGKRVVISLGQSRESVVLTKKGSETRLSGSGSHYQAITDAMAAHDLQRSGEFAHTGHGRLEIKDDQITLRFDWVNPLSDFASIRTALGQLFPNRPIKICFATE